LIGSSLPAPVDRSAVSDRLRRLLYCTGRCGDISLEHQVISNRDICGRVAFRIIGGFALLLALFWNPIVLRPRFWNATVIAREVAIEVTLIVVGFGLVGIRKWAPVGLSVITVFLVAKGGLGLFGICMFLTSSILTVAFWSALVRGKRQDFLYLFAAVLISVLAEYIAFVLRRA
jgi:hypothetical protein